MSLDLEVLEPCLLQHSCFHYICFVVFFIVYLYVGTSTSSCQKSAHNDCIFLFLDYDNRSKQVQVAEVLANIPI